MVSIERCQNWKLAIYLKLVRMLSTGSGRKPREVCGLCLNTHSSLQSISHCWRQCEIGNVIILFYGKINFCCRQASTLLGLIIDELPTIKAEEACGIISPFRARTYLGWNSSSWAISLIVFSPFIAARTILVLSLECSDRSDIFQVLRFRFIGRFSYHRFN